MSQVLDAALVAMNAGLSVVPPRDDGSKGPAFAWLEFQGRRADEAELRHWYANGVTRHGLGLVCGRISGNLETFEFEGRAVDGGLWDEFKAAMIDAGLQALLSRVQRGYGERTPSGGIHLLYRCPETVDGNLKLARRLGADDKPEVLIETRGEGGYVVVAPSAGPVHQTGKPWQLLAGGFESIATITAEERAEIFAIARSFDSLPQPDWSTPESSRGEASGRPGDDFNARADWARDVLEPAGWTRTGSRAGREHWYRGRGGRPGWTSATITPDGQYLYVFSSSTELPTEVGISKFGAYALLHHGGRFDEAATALRAAGYGESPGEIRQGSHQVPPPPPGTPEAGPWLTPLAELLTKPEELRDWLVEGLLIRGGLGVIGAKPKVGKTTMSHQLALAVSRGEKFLGRRTKAGPVIYLAFEEDRNEVVGRFRRLGATADNPVHLLIGPAGPEGIKKLETAIRELGAVLAVVDPIQRLTHLENIGDYSEVSNATDPLIAIARATGCALIFSHHLGKMDRDSGDQLLGSQALFGSVDSAVILRKADGGVRSLETIQRYGKSLEPVVLGFSEETGATWIEGRVEDYELERDRVEVLKIIAGSMEPITQSELIDSLAMGWMRVRRAVDQMVTEHQVERRGAGRRSDPFRFRALIQPDDLPTSFWNSKPFLPELKKETEKPSNEETSSLYSPDPPHDFLLPLKGAEEGKSGPLRQTHGVMPTSDDPILNLPRGKVACPNCNYQLFSTGPPSRVCPVCHHAWTQEVSP